MNIDFLKAVRSDCEEIQKIQQKSFAQLLDKYQDFDTNPATEKLGYRKTGKEEDIKQGMTIVYYQKIK